MTTFEELYERYCRSWHPLIASIEAQKELNRENTRTGSREVNRLGDDNS